MGREKTPSVKHWVSYKVSAEAGDLRGKKG